MAKRDKVALILAGGRIIRKRPPGADDELPLDTEEMTNAYFTDEMREKVYVVDWSRQPVTYYTLRMCGDLIQMAGAQIEEGACASVITCGIQGLVELAYYADLVWSYPQPLIFTSSVNNAGSLGSETALHLSQAVMAAQSQACWGQGALICVQDGLYAALEVRQLSNCVRSGYDAFPSGPIAQFTNPDCLTFFRSSRRGKIMNIGTTPARNVEILDVTLGGGDLLLNALLDGRISELDGLVVSAFGGGDVPPSWVPLLRKIMRSEVPVVLASRCPMGRVLEGGGFEGSSSHLLEMGILSAGALTPLQARIRLAVGLGAELKGHELRSYMLNE